MQITFDTQVKIALYTDKGILVIEFQLNVEFRKVISKKFTDFYFGYMIPE